MTSLTMLQTFCFASSIRPPIEPVVSITKTSSIVGLPPATSLTCTAGLVLGPGAAGANRTANPMRSR